LRITGSYFLPFNCEKTYTALQDPAVAIRCLPDFETLERVGPDEYAVTMRLTFATLPGAFTGSIKIVEPDPPNSFKILVAGDVMLDFFKGEGIMRLKPAREGTELTYDGDVQVGGILARLGQRVIDNTAKLMIRRFFDKFVQEVKGHL
jgi:carbon monoxide dehydrogenase subunit G